MAVYKQGMSGSGVKDLQAQLNKLGAGLSPDGQYGPKTTEAVEWFQKNNGLTVDGVAGPATLAVIDTRINTIIGEKVTAALEALAKVPEVKELAKWLN